MTEGRPYVTGRDPVGCYSRDINYTGASLPQLASLTKVFWHCEQFINFECNVSMFFMGGPWTWWGSHDSAKMTCWGGASVNGKCACGMTSSCAFSSLICNCDVNDQDGVKTAVS